MNKLKFWFCVDKNGMQVVFADDTKPERDLEEGIWVGRFFIEFNEYTDNERLSKMTWEDEPVLIKFEPVE